MVALALAIFSAQMADLLTFICAVTILPIRYEANPIVGFLFMHAGLAGVAGFKIGGTVLAIGIVAITRDPRFRAALVTLGVGVGIVGALSNTAGVLTLR